MTTVQVNTPHLMILDIGCGENKVPGSIGIDFNSNIGADVVHDLNKFPYPFKSDFFDEVHIKDTLFLLDNPVHVMEEIYRVCKKHAKVVVVQPYFRSVWNYVDPWVKSFGTAHSFAFYDPNDAICKRYKYTKARFLTTRISFNDHLVNPILIRRLFIYFANRYPRQYELYFSHLFPLDVITYNLKKL